MDKNTKEIIKVVFTGDFCPMHRVEELARSGNYEAILGNYMDVLNGNDINVVDLECPLTESKKVRPKTGPPQKAHPDGIRILKYAGVNLVAMSNNHIMDYDNQGVEDTLSLCAENEIDTVGIGESQESAARPFLKDLKGKRIAILNFADKEFITTQDNSFICNALDPVNSSYDIKKYKKEADFVIVTVHAGNEFYKLPSPRIKKLYRFLIDAGADAVISHHTHVFSGYEVYNSKPIFYGLGNFIYDWPGKRNTTWNTGYTVKLSLSDRIDFEIIPMKQGNEEPGVFHLTEKEVKVFNREMEELNQVIQNDEKLEQEFQAYCRSVYPMYDAYIEPYFGKFLTALRRRGFFPKLMSRKKRLLILNLSRCDSHRDVLVRMLEDNS